MTQSRASGRSLCKAGVLSPQSTDTLERLHERQVCALEQELSGE
jgi:hypothetical protein